MVQVDLIQPYQISKEHLGGKGELPFIIAWYGTCTTIYTLNPWFLMEKISDSPLINLSITGTGVDSSEQGKVE
jgi:hypothetical protein